MDLISRQAAIDALIRKTRPHDNGDGTTTICVMSEGLVREVITDLPTAEPRKGKWERHYSRPNVYADLFWHCSECGYKNDENYAPVYHHFCPNCGARMEN